MISNRWAEWRNRRLRDSAFRRRLHRNPLTRPVARRRAQALFDINAGFINSQVLAACLELKLLQRLREAPQDVSALATALEVDETRLTRLLEAASELDLLERRPGKRWGLGAQGAVLESDPGLLAMSLHHAALYRDLADPVSLLRGTEDETRLARLWAYAGTSEPGSLQPAATREYTDLMAASQRMIAEQVLDAFDFTPFTSLLDIGGGSGAFVTAIGEAYPDLALGLMDLPAVIPHARAALQTTEPGERVQLHGGDFHTDPLPGGHDLLSLVRIVHDHDDEPVRRLLSRAFDALEPGGTLLIAEPMLGSHDRGGSLGNYFRFYLMAMGSGRPRSAGTLKRFLGEAGFRKPRRHGTPIPLICDVLSARKP